MVEFAIVVIALFSLIGLLIDGGMAIWSKSILSEVVQEIAADRAIHLNATEGLARSLNVEARCGIPCLTRVGKTFGMPDPEFWQFDELNNCIDAVGDAKYRQFAQADSESLQFSGEIQHQLFGVVAGAGGGISPGDYFLKIDAKWDYPCFFCRLLGSRVSLNATTKVPLETASSALPVCFARGG